MVLTFTVDEHLILYVVSNFAEKSIENECINYFAIKLPDFNLRLVKVVATF